MVNIETIFSVIGWVNLGIGLVLFVLFYYRLSKVKLDIRVPRLGLDARAVNLIGMLALHKPSPLLKRKKREKTTHAPDGKVGRRSSNELRK